VVRERPDLHHLHLGDAKVEKDGLLDPSVRRPARRARLGDAQRPAVEAGDDLVDHVPTRGVDGRRIGVEVRDGARERFSGRHREDP